MQGAESALDFSATARLAHLAIASSLGPCLVHRKGALTVEACLLRTDAQGLGHLISPLVTRARGPGSPVEEPQRLGHGVTLGSGEQKVLREHAAAAAAAAVEGEEDAVGGMGGSAGGVQGRPECAMDLNKKKQSAAAAAEAKQGLGSKRWGSKANGAGAAGLGSKGAGSVLAAAKVAVSAAVGPGRLSVLESRLLGGCTAVRCEGTGQVRSVRVIYEAHATLFYLEVDSSEPQGWKGIPAGLGRLGSQLQEQWQQQQQISIKPSSVVQLLRENVNVASMPRTSRPAVPACRGPTEGVASGLGLFTTPPAGAAAGLRKIQQLLGGINPGMLEEHLRDKRGM